MSKKFVNVYFVLSLFVFCLAISLFASNIIKEYNFEKTNTERAFKEAVQDFQKQPLLASVKSFQNNENIAAAEIIRGGKIIYEKHEGFDFANPGSMVKSFSAKTGTDSEPCTLNIAFYLINPDSIYRNAKTAFAIILGLTVLTALLILLNSLEEQKNPQKEQEDSTKMPETSELEEGIQAEAAPSDYTDQQETSAQEAYAEPDAQEKAEAAETVEKTEIEEPAYKPQPEPAAEFETEAISETHAFQPEESNDEQEPAEEVKLDDKFQSLENEDIALFAEEKQEETEAAEAAPVPAAEQKEQSPLVLKLNVCLSDKEKDLSLFLLKAPAADLTGTIKDFLSPGYFDAGSVFDYNADTLALVKSGMNIDDAETFASEVHSNLTEKLGGQIAKIGISSRATRDITAERLITEVLEALKHAQTDEESHIIGFHVDIEKYNEYLKNSENQ